MPEPFRSIAKIFVGLLIVLVISGSFTYGFVSATLEEDIAFYLVVSLLSGSIIFGLMSLGFLFEAGPIANRIIVLPILVGCTGALIMGVAVPVSQDIAAEFSQPYLSLFMGGFALGLLIFFLSEAFLPSGPETGSSPGRLISAFVSGLVAGGAYFVLEPLIGELWAGGIMVLILVVMLLLLGFPVATLGEFIGFLLGLSVGGVIGYGILSITGAIDFSHVGSLAINLSIFYVGAALGLPLGKSLGTRTRRVVSPILKLYTRVWPYLREMLRPVAGFFFGYVVIALLFAGFFSSLFHTGGGFTGLPQDPSFWDFIYLSIVTLTSLGYGLGHGDIEATSLAAKALISLEVILGIGWLVVLFAAVIAYLEPRFSEIRAENMMLDNLSAKVENGPIDLTRETIQEIGARAHLSSHDSLRLFDKLRNEGQVEADLTPASNSTGWTHAFLKKVRT